MAEDKDKIIHNAGYSIYINKKSVYEKTTKLDRENNDIKEQIRKIVNYLNKQLENEEFNRFIKKTPDFNSGFLDLSNKLDKLFKK